MKVFRSLLYIGRTLSSEFLLFFFFSPKCRIVYVFFFFVQRLYNCVIAKWRIGWTLNWNGIWNDIFRF